jgi:hypothetical protein
LRPRALCPDERAMRYEYNFLGAKTPRIWAGPHVLFRTNEYASRSERERQACSLITVAAPSIRLAGSLAAKAVARQGMGRLAVRTC